MGILYVDTLEPQSGTTLTVGETGQNTVVGGNTIKLNTLKDAGGNTLFTSDGSGNLSSVNSGFGAPFTLIQAQTVSSAVASLTFTSGISSAYNTYLFGYYTIAPVTEGAHWGFQCSTDGGSNYNTTLTSTAWYANHTEAGTGGALTYYSAEDQAQGTAYQNIDTYVDDTAPACTAGYLYIYDLGSTTYVKNFYSRGVRRPSDGNLSDTYIAGYFNTASAIDAVSFKFSTGNIAAGKVKMWGMK